MNPIEFTGLLLVAFVLLCSRRPRRAVSDPVGEAWAHRRFLECGYIAEHPNRWRL